MSHRATLASSRSLSEWLFCREEALLAAVLRQCGGVLLVLVQRQLGRSAWSPLVCLLVSAVSVPPSLSRAVVFSSGSALTLVLCCVGLLRAGTPVESLNTFLWQEPSGSFTSVTWLLAR